MCEHCVFDTELFGELSVFVFRRKIISQKNWFVPINMLSFWFSFLLPKRWFYVRVNKILNTLYSQFTSSCSSLWAPYITASLLHGLTHNKYSQNSHPVETKSKTIATLKPNARFAGRIQSMLSVLLLLLLCACTLWWSWQIFTFQNCKHSSGKPRKNRQP